MRSWTMGDNRFYVTFVLGNCPDPFNGILWRPGWYGRYPLRERTDYFQVMDFIGEKDDTTPAEGIHRNKMFKAGYRADKLDRENNFGHH